MSLTLAQLVAPQTAAQWKANLLAALQGVGLVQPRGIGTGSITPAITGTLVAYDVLITIVAKGELGTATFNYKLTTPQGIITQSGTIVVPGGGTYAIAGTGVTITFAAGPTGSGDSFSVGDTYGFSITIPTFPVTAWQEGGVARTLVELFASALADADLTVAAVAAGGLLNYVTTIGSSAGAWLDLIADSMYELTRNAAVATQGLVTLTASAGNGPFNITAGQLRIASSNGLIYQNNDAGTIPLSGSHQFTFMAEKPGTAYNVGNNTITTLVTSLAGVSCNNPDPGGGDWKTVTGTDAETDAALILRCQQRWPGLGGGATAAVYQFWAATASSQVTRSQVIADTGVPGQVDVYLASASGGVAGGVVTAVQSYINQRLPLTCTAVVASASNHAVTVTATVYVKAAFSAAAQAEATTNLATYFNNLPIGGDVAAGPGGIVSREAVIAAIGKITGVVDISMSAPAADVALTSHEVATLTQALTWVSV